MIFAHARYDRTMYGKFPGVCGNTIVMPSPTSSRTDWRRTSASRAVNGSIASCGKNMSNPWNVSHWKMVQPRNELHRVNGQRTAGIEKWCVDALEPVSFRHDLLGWGLMSHICCLALPIKRAFVWTTLFACS